MQNTFLPDLAAAVLGAVMGSVLTVAITLVTYRLQRRSNEKHALRPLVDENHRPRVLTPIVNAKNVPGAEQLDDFDNVNPSVLDIRDLIRLAPAQTRPESDAQKPLSDMTRACNRYLQATARQLDRYLHHLMFLRGTLWECIQEMARETQGIPAMEPAGAAY